MKIHVISSLPIVVKELIRPVTGVLESVGVLSLIFISASYVPF